MAVFEDLPCELRLDIASYFDRWPDLQSFRHCCRDNYFILTRKPCLTLLYPLSKGDEYFLTLTGLYIELSSVDLEKLQRARIVDKDRYSYIREAVKRIGTRDITNEEKINHFCRLRNLMHTLIVFGAAGKIDLHALCRSLWKAHCGWEGLGKGAKYQEMEDFVISLVRGLRRARGEMEMVV